MSKKKRIFLFILSDIIAILILLFFTPVGNWILGERIQYKFKPESVTNYDISQEISGRIDMKNPPKFVEEKIPQEMRDVKFVSQYSGVQKVEEFKSGIGKMALSRKLLKEEMITDKGKNVKQINIKQTEENATLQLKPNGQVVILEPAGNDKAYKVYETVFQQIPLPSGRIRPGFTWSEDIKTPYNTKVFQVKVDLKGKINYRFDKYEKYKDVNCALITYDGDLDIGGQQVQETAIGDLVIKGQKTKQTIAGDIIIENSGKGKLSGKIYFDTSKGQVVWAKNEMNLNIKIDYKGKLIDALKEKLNITYPAVLLKYSTSLQTERK